MKKVLFSIVCMFALSFATSIGPVQHSEGAEQQGKTFVASCNHP